MHILYLAHIALCVQEVGRTLSTFFLTPIFFTHAPPPLFLAALLLSLLQTLLLRVPTPSQYCLTLLE